MAAVTSIRILGTPSATHRFFPLPPLWLPAKRLPETNFVNIGGYGPGYSSSGDCFSIENVGTYCATNKQGVNNGDVITDTNPMNGAVLSDLTTTTGYASLFGLAGWQGAIFGFNSGGEVIKIDPENGDVELLTDSNNSWWGAGVRTVIPQ